MRLETFRGRDLRAVSARAREALGADVMIVRTRVLRIHGEAIVEVVAAAAREVEGLRVRLAPAPLPGRSSGARPFVLALVGPTGAGKTTTAAKLAVHADAFGAHRVGFLTLDTFRAGALDQLQAYADVAQLPLEVAYDAQDAAPAMKRLAGCDVVIVDTPGRGPRTPDADAQWRDVLRALQPDETHLVLPATLRTDVAVAMRDAFAAHAVDHLLLTKLDEVPGESGVADLAARMALPTRWVTDGQEIPADLRAGVPRVLAALGAFTTDVVVA